MIDLGMLGLLAVFLCPMVFGGITFYYSWKVVDERENKCEQDLLVRHLIYYMQDMYKCYVKQNNNVII